MYEVKADDAEGDETEQNKEAVILMEENIEQVFLVGVFSHPEGFIVDIPIMIIIDELPDERGI